MHNGEIMSIASAKQTPRNSYTATSGQTSFNIGFEFFAIADVKVYRNGTLLTYNASPSSVSQYSITGTADATDSANEFGSGGSITLGSGATAGDIIVIIRDLVIERSTDFVPNATFNVTDLNSQLDQILAMVADLDQQSQRSVKLLDTDTIAATVTLPAKATRASKVATFDSDGNLETTIAAVDVTTVAGIATDISTVAGISSNVTSVASNSSNINTVAGIQANITTVAGISSNVTTVAGIQANVTTVAGIQANVTTVAGISSDVSAVAGISSNVTTVAGAVTNINTVAGSIANVNEVANNMGSVNDFAARYRVGSSDPTDSLDEGDLFYNTTSNALKFHNGSAWVSVNVTGIGSVADDSTPQLGGNLDVNGNSIVSTSDGNISITPNGTGDVIIDGLKHPQADGSNGQFLKTNGSAQLSFASVTQATGNELENVVEDTTPQLGGMLDVNGNALGDGTLELIKFSETASAVNEFTVKNAATGNAPELQATGDDTNIDIKLVPKGTGDVVVGAVSVKFTNWTITEDSGVLKFATGGTNKMKLDASGNLTVVGDVTAFGTI